MKSGMKDYDDQWLTMWTLSHPDDDFTPLDFLYNVNKTFYFPPGEGEAYSSVGFGLLGLVLVSHSNVTNWENFN